MVTILCGWKVGPVKCDVAGHHPTFGMQIFVGNTPQVLQKYLSESLQMK